MKGIFFSSILIAIFLFAGKNLSAQVFWTEDFGTGCNQALLAISFSDANGAWTVSSTGTNDTYHNCWYVSAEENGQIVGSCNSTGCSSNKTLHIGIKAYPNPFPFGSSPYPTSDIGAIYNDGANSIYNAVTTNLRVESPTINCTGSGNITLSFDYIVGTYSFLTNDEASLYYFDGITWTYLNYLPLTSGSCGGSGATWTTYSVVLPTSADNNPNVKIGFNWTNDFDGVGINPAIAIDNITLNAGILLSIDLKSFTAEKSGNNIALNWETLSEKNNAYFEIERAEKANSGNFTTIGKIKSKGNISQAQDYQFTDDNPYQGINYYRLKTVDNNGKNTFSKPVAVDFYGNANNLKVTPNPARGSFYINFISTSISQYQIQIINTCGQVAYNTEIQAIKGYNQIKISSSLSAGIYEVQLIGNKDYFSGKVVVE